MLIFARGCSQINQVVDLIFRTMVVRILDRPQFHDISRPSTRDPEMRRY